MSTATQTLIDIARLAMQARRLTESGESSYRDAIRSAVRGLWSGATGSGQFYVQMSETIQRRLTQAWYEGAAAVGVQPDELSDGERAALAQAIAEEKTYIAPFSSEIGIGSKIVGGKLQPLLDRAELWPRRYNDVRNRAMTMARADAKLQWQMGLTKEHCVDCLRYHGRVYRASAWLKSGARPQHRDLSCHGFHCLCKFTPVSLPCTRGRVPAMTGTGG